MINLGSILQLTRPLTVFDLETTGNNPDIDRIWQMSITQHYATREPIRWTSYIRPGIPIPPELIERMKIHVDVLTAIEHAPPFSHYASDLVKKVFHDTDYAGHNILFDLRVVRAELNRLKIDWDWTRTDANVICTLRIYQTKNPRDLQAAYKEYVDPTGFEGAHDAGNDVAATEEVLVGQLTRHPEIPRTIPELAKFCFPKDPDWICQTNHLVWRHGEATIGFGKHNGTTLREMVERRRDYLENFILANNFPADVQEVVRRAIAGEFPARDR